MVANWKNQYEQLLKKYEQLVEENKSLKKEVVNTVSLPQREREAFEMVSLRGKSGLGVFELVSERTISYPAAYKLLENLKKKGLITEKWEEKGHKKKYYANV